MRIRRGVVALAAVSLSASLAVVAAPSSSATEPVRVLTVSASTQAGDPDTVLATVGFAGPVSRVEATWSRDAGSGLVQTFLSTSDPVDVGATTAVATAYAPPTAVAGSWTVTSVTLVDENGGRRTTDGPFGPSPTTTVSSGPADLAALQASLPTVSSVAFNKGASAGAATELSIDVAWSGATGVVLPVLRNATTGVLLAAPAVVASTTTGTGSVTFTPGDVGLTPGTWSLDRLLTTGDIAGPVRVYRSSGTVDTLVPGDVVSGVCSTAWAEHPSSSCVAVSTGAHGLDWPSAGPVVTGTSNRDYAAPRLTAISLSPTSVGRSGTVTVSATYVDATDDPTSGGIASDVGSLSVELLSSTFESPIFSQVSDATCDASVPRTCQVTVELTIRDNARFATFTGLSATVTDAAGNQRAYLRDHVEVTTWAPDAWRDELTPSDVDVTDLQLTVVPPGVAAESTPPTLLSLTRVAPPVVDSTDSTTLGNGHTFAWTVTDGAGSGVTRVSLRLVNPASGQLRSFGWFSQWPASSGTLTIPFDTWPEGDWVVRSVTVGDRLGSTRRYDADGTVSTGGTHAFDLASLGVRSVRASVPDGLPSAPRALTLYGKAGSLGVSWTAPLQTGSGITGYQLSSDGGVTWGPTLQADAISGVVTGAAGTAVSVAVRAVTAAGPGPIAWRPSRVVELDAPVAPTVVPYAAVLTPTGTSASPAIPVAGSYPGYGPDRVMATETKVAAVGAVLPSTWTRSATRTSPNGTSVAVPRGSRLCMRLVAINAVATTPSAQTCTLVLGDDRSLTRSSGWSSTSLSSAYVGTLTRSTKLGATLTASKVVGRTLRLQARAVPGGGTVAVYRGTTLVGTWSLAASSARTVSKAFTLNATGQKLTLKVTKVGTAGVTIDGWGVAL